MFKVSNKHKGFINGNSVRLLENGEEFFPLMIRRIRNAKKEIFIETFILLDDEVGKPIQKALIQAAKRGVWVGVTVDSYGSFELTTEFIEALTEAGVIFQVYDPKPSLIRSKPSMFRRLHRKLVVIDNYYALVGGINLSYRHMTRYGPGAKEDFAVEVAGPVVPQIRQLCKSYVSEARDENLGELAQTLKSPEVTGDADVAFVSRDNKRNRSEIEKAYIYAIHAAKYRVVIANAYFFPGYRMMRALRKAARRGVEVELVLQGEPDIPIALRAARSLYSRLARADIKIYEYTERPLHAKIAVVDDTWSTVGSSNLDPLSFSLNLEANVVVLDKNLNRDIYRHIRKLIGNSDLIGRSWLAKRPWWNQVMDVVTYHVLRHLPSLVGWFPAHTPRIHNLRGRYQTEIGTQPEGELEKRFPESRQAQPVSPKHNREKSNIDKSGTEQNSPEKQQISAQKRHARKNPSSAGKYNVSNLKTGNAAQTDYPRMPTTTEKSRQTQELEDA